MTTEDYIEKPSRIVADIHPNGRQEGEYRVSFTPSGLHLTLQSRDVDGNQGAMLISRFAWEGIAQAVTEIFAQEEKEAQEHNSVMRMLDPDY